MAGADVNAFMVLDYRAMALVADRLGKRRGRRRFPGHAPARWPGRQRPSLGPGRLHLLQPTTAVERARVRCVTYSNLVPLWAGLASPETGPGR